MIDLPQLCDRAGCQAPIDTWCPICSRFFCQEHDRLPDGHLCLAAVRFNAQRVLDADEVDQALEHFRPL